MGASEKEIPEDAPAKQLAERLRELRRAAGMPPYRDMGAAIFLCHNSLSRVASGVYVRWESVMPYVAALRALAGPDAVTDHDVAHLHDLWEEARRRRSSRVVGGISRISDHTRAGIRRIPVLVRSSSAGGESPAARPIPPPRAAPEMADARTRLEQINRVADLVAALNELAVAHRVDLRALGAGRRAPEREAWDMLTGHQPPTAAPIRYLVVDLCGRPATEFAWWVAALWRSTPPAPDPVVVPERRAPVTEAVKPAQRVAPTTSAMENEVSPPRERRYWWWPFRRSR